MSTHTLNPRTRNPHLDYCRDGKWVAFSLDSSTKPLFIFFGKIFQQISSLSGLHKIISKELEMHENVKVDPDAIRIHELHPTYSHSWIDFIWGTDGKLYAVPMMSINSNQVPRWNDAVKVQNSYSMSLDGENCPVYPMSCIHSPNWPIHWNPDLNADGN
uniref:Uncharacterized protein n=1 Tax=Percolomonas cosmopolitus TaxID=63605 RepID=A0A7S1KRP5_9EUKA|eukprot:CAMPEP_0117441778 /NCGR_PEP_ID=MMETSP0759-20121206/3808_1 /TAXON_ID=63605 /ORGANISM="Percolomonas cosmopolitus, Strain WS" /LENGTH=158 /DNA_ID=CAMNT_0005233639 /DNA_START=122 /DNA_END=598 /DNA_ORIENTATION=-